MRPDIASQYAMGAVLRRVPLLPSLMRSLSFAALVFHPFFVLLLGQKSLHFGVIFMLHPAEVI
jgi:hypothetical protein